MTITVNAEELQYVDRAAGRDKFYRIYSWNNIWTAQYGRNGTFGTFSRKVCGSHHEAQDAAEKQLRSKFAKGYESVKSVLLTFDKEPTDAQLDTAMMGPGTPVSSKVSDKTVAQTVQSLAKILSDTSARDAVDPFVQEAVTQELKRNGFPVTADALGPDKPLRPMLAETAPLDVSGLLQDDGWISQYKLDGERYVVEVNEGEVAVYNRQGQPKISNVAPETLTPFYNLTDGYWVFDGELIGRTLHLFDMAAAGGHLHREAPFRVRYEALVHTLTAMKALESPEMCLLPNIIGVDDKTLALQQAHEDGREGIIFRRLSASYQFGRRSTDLLKYKFIKEVDVWVSDVKIKGKDNAELSVYRDGEPVVVGQVSTIGKGEVNVGDVLEVKFLYVLDPEHPKLYQPRILRKRTDKSADECSIAQFANAGTNKEI